MRYGNPQRQIAPRSAATRRCDPSSCSRSIRNVRRRPPRRPATGVRRAKGDALAAGDPRRPPYYHVPPTSKRWPRRCAKGSPGSISSRRLCSPPSTACGKLIDKGDPYYCHYVKTAGCCARRWAGRNSGCGSPSSRDFGRAEWLKPYTARPSRSWRKTASSGSQSSRRASRGLHRDAGGDGDPARNVRRARWRALCRPALPQQSAASIAALSAIAARELAGRADFPALSNGSTKTTGSRRSGPGFGAPNTHPACLRRRASAPEPGSICFVNSM